MPKEPKGKITCPRCGAKLDKVEVVVTDIVMVSDYEIVDVIDGVLQLALIERSTEYHEGDGACVVLSCKQCGEEFPYNTDYEVVS